ncbi:MAG: molybdenum cofactor biosynthesis protein MoaE [Deinococcota bacterium]
MIVQILLFASYREVIGDKEVSLECPLGTTARSCATLVEQTYGISLKGALCAINEHYADPDTVIQASDKVAFFPPVSGGASSEVASTTTEDVFIVTEDVLELDTLSQQARAAAWGAQASFIGTVRSPNLGEVVTHIDYEGYNSMILTQMQQVAGELRAQFELGKIVIAHRLGRLFPGDTSIAIVIASAHRREALDACNACIELCKERLPVWKYEVTETGADWVAGNAQAAQPL